MYKHTFLKLNNVTTETVLRRTRILCGNRWWVGCVVAGAVILSVLIATDGAVQEAGGAVRAVRAQLGTGRVQEADVAVTVSHWI